MTGNIVARRYARALFAIGRDKGDEALNAFGRDLAGIAELLEGAPELLRIFRNPIFSVEEKKMILEKLMAKIKPQDLTKNFLFLLADKERLGALPEIAFVFGELLDAEQGIVRGEVVTAIDLNKTKQKALKDQLEKQSGKKLVLEFSKDKQILGGLVLKVGDMIMDASLRAQLGMLQENIKRGE